MDDAALDELVAGRLARGFAREQLPARMRLSHGVAEEDVRRALDRLERRGAERHKRFRRRLFGVGGLAIAAGFIAEALGAPHTVGAIIVVGFLCGGAFLLGLAANDVRNVS